MPKRKKGNPPLWSVPRVQDPRYAGWTVRVSELRSGGTLYACFRQGGRPKMRSLKLRRKDLGSTAKEQKARARAVRWSLGAGHVGGAPEPNPHKAALQAIASQYKERGVQDPTTVPGSVTTRVFYDIPKTPPGWTPAGDPLYSDSATPEFRRATGGGE